MIMIQEIVYNVSSGGHRELGQGHNKVTTNSTYLTFDGKQRLRPLTVHKNVIQYQQECKELYL